MEIICYKFSDYKFRETFSSEQISCCGNSVIIRYSPVGHIQLTLS